MTEEHIYLGDAGPYQDDISARGDELDRQYEELSRQIESLRGSRDYGDRSRRIALKQERREIRRQGDESFKDELIGIISALEKSQRENPSLHWRAKVLLKHGMWEPRWRTNESQKEIIDHLSKCGQILELKKKRHGKQYDWITIIKKES